MSLLNLPDNTIAESKKLIDFHIEHGKYFAQHFSSSGFTDQKEQMLKYYRAYNAELSDEEELMMRATVCPNGLDMGVKYIVYPLIQTKIEQLVGEYSLRPKRSKTYVMDKKSKNEKYQKKLQMLSEEIMRGLSQKMSPELGFAPKTENEKMELPPNVEEFFKKDFKTLAEQVGDKLIKLFMKVNKNEQKFKELLLDFCVVDRAHAVLEKKHGHTMARKVHPMDATYDIDPYKIVQDNHEYFSEGYMLTENEIYNSFPKLTELQKKEVRKMFAAASGSGIDAQNSEDLSMSRKYDGWYSTTNNIGRLKVVSAMWKSSKKINIKESKSKNTGDTFYKKLNDKDEIRKKDKVEVIHGEMPRFVVMIGPDICLDWGLMEKRFSSIDDIFTCYLPVVSVIRDNTTGTSTIKSVAAKLYQLQELASEVLFEIRLAIKHMADSRVLVYDVAQTPSDFTKDGYESGLNKVLHHIKKDKMLFINSSEKGFKNTFNQFTSLDLSAKGSIQDMFNGLAVIEDLASKFAGISPQREGNVGQYETAAGAQQAISGSAARSETIFGPFDDFIQALLGIVLRRAKQDYEEGEVIQYIIGELETKFLKLFKEFFMADLGMYLSDGRRDQKLSQQIDRAAEQALSNSNTPEMVMGLIEIFEEETAGKKKEVFQRMLDAMSAMRAESQKAAEAQAQAQAEAAKAASEQDLLKSREGNLTEKEVATIYANSKAHSDNTKASSDERIKAAELSVKEKEKVKSE